MLKPFIALALALAAFTMQAPATAQTCRWDGTAPFCEGSCGAGESETTRLSSMPDHWQDANPGVQNTNFGEPCWTGSKALCCPAPRGSECRWDGSGPFCRGRCGAGEAERSPPPGSSSGQGCASGKKVYCCRSNTGTSRAALKTNNKLTQFAALWDKSASSGWEVRHGLGSQQYQALFGQMAQRGYRPVAVRGYSVNNQPTYAAIFEKRQGPPFVARHQLTRDAYQRKFDRLTRDGYRPVDVSGFTSAGVDHYNAIFEKADGPPFRAFHGLSADAYQQEFDRAVQDGYRPLRVSGYTINGRDHYAAIFEQRAGPPFAARHGLTSAQYQQAFSQLASQGYRLTHLSSWGSGITGHYAAIWEKADGPAWQARHGMLEDTYQEQFNDLAKAGYRLRDISAFHLYE